MTADATGASPATRVFVSYSHDSKAHAKRVLLLVDRLRAKGIDCEVDAFEEAPPEGWPAWMARQIREARYVLVVCTETYHRRVTGREKTGVGLGARWEGAHITQDLYERGGQNDKFIPVVLATSDVAEIPDFLRHTTRYDLSGSDGFSKLYRRLTQQPKVVKRPLGQIEAMPPEQPKREPAKRPASRTKGARSTTPPRPEKARNRGSQAQIAIMEPGKGVRFVPIVRIEVRSTIEAVLKPDDSRDRAYLEALITNRFRPTQVGVAFGLTASWARIASVTRTFEQGEDQFAVTFVPDEHSRNNTEVSTTGVSADDIAVLRARRILLDERPPSSESKWHTSGRDSMRESLVRGMNSVLSVERSPLPDLFRVMSGQPASQIVSAAKLVAVLWLRLTNTVEHILELDLRVTAKPSLNIKFRGQRASLYTNRSPVEIAFEGTCDLSV